MLKKIFKAGKDLAVPLPDEMLEPLGITDGASVSVVLDRAKSEIVIRSTSSALADDVDENFVRQVNEFIDEYRPALEALARQ